jgi:hypothetical protein
MNVSRRAALVGTALAASIALAPAASASGGGGGGAQVNGMCTGSSSSTLKAKPGNGRLEVEFEVDSNRVGQKWSVRLADNGTQFFAGTRTTMAPSGSFEVRKFTANRPGADRIVARATNSATGEVCRASLTV